MNKISRKANHGLSLCLLLFVVFIFSSADAMIRDISLNELIKRSDVVAVVDIARFD